MTVSCGYSDIEFTAERNSTCELLTRIPVCCRALLTRPGEIANLSGVEVAPQASVEATAKIPTTASSTAIRSKMQFLLIMFKFVRFIRRY